MGGTSMSSHREPHGHYGLQQRHLLRRPAVFIRGLSGALRLGRGMSLQLSMDFSISEKP